MTRRLVPVVLVLTAAACDCGGKSHNVAPTLLVLDKDGAMRTSVDFGLVQVGVKGTQKLRIKNDGTAPLEISAETFTDMHFGIDTSLPFDLEAATEGELTLTFTPDTPDLRVTGMSTLTSNDPEALTYDLSVAGQGVTAVAKVSPSPVDFGDVYVGEMKQVMLTVTNAGGNDLPVTSAKLTGNPPGVTADFTALTNAMVPAGGSTSVTLTLAPTAIGDVTGGVEIDLDAMYGGNLSVPLQGRGTQAQPTMCFKYDDTMVESCTGAATNLDIPFGQLCDSHAYTCTGGSDTRSGTLYFKNTGNVPVKYSVRYAPYPYSTARCDGGQSAQSDFTFDNVPVPDGGAPMPLDVSTTQLPMALSDPMPWQTTPIHITYRASSRCVSEGADQATVIWTRQDPIGVSHPPSTLLATLNGQSLLPAAKAKPVNIGQQNSPASVPFSVPLPVELVTNQGYGPLTVNAVTLYEEAGCALSDGGMTDGGCMTSCAGSTSANCSGFAWADGGSPLQLLPVWLDGGAVSPTQQVIGRLYVGCVANDSTCPTALTNLRVYAVVSTTDPYAAQVPVLLNAWVQHP